MRLHYISHPLRAIDGETFEGNVRAASLWLKRMSDSNPADAFIAPYLDSIMAGAKDHDPEAREMWLRRDEEVASRCDSVILCGSRIGAGGWRECAAQARGRGSSWQQPRRGVGRVFRFTEMPATPTRDNTPPGGGWSDPAFLDTVRMVDAGIPIGNENADCTLFRCRVGPGDYDILDEFVAAHNRYSNRYSNKTP